MRIPSGVTDQVLYFVAVDATDFTTREVKVDGFQVWRSRDGGVGTAYTTPTVASVGTTMPGVYHLLLDEDMSITAGNYSEEIAVHITSTDGHIAPVTRVFELYDDRMTTATGLIVTNKDALNFATGEIAQILLDVAAVETSITFATKGIQDQVIPKLTTATGRLVDLATGGGYLKTGMTFATGEIAQLILDVATNKTSLNFATGEIAQLLLDVALVKTSVDTATERISFLSTGGGPFPGGAADSAAIADAVWDEAFADHVGVTTFGHLKTQLNFATGEIAQLLIDVEVNTTALSALEDGLDFATERISYLTTGGGPFPGGGSAPSAATIADAVWDEAFGDHTTSTTFGHLKTQQNFATGEIAQLLVDTAALEVSITFATKGIQDQVIPKLTTATGRLVDLATGGGVAVPDLLATNKTALNFATGEIAQLLVDVAALNDISVSDILTTQMTEAYSADGSAPTLAQALFLIQQSLGDFSISGTTLTVKKVDGSTTAATFTLNDATAPTSLTRSG